MSKHVFCCFKIKTATLLIGMLDLMTHLMILVTLLTSIQRPLDSQGELVGFDSPPQQPLLIQVGSPADNDNSKLSNDFGSFYINRSAQNKPFGLLITICSTFITMMLIYGVINNRPSYLMPYFSIKVFHVVITCLSTLGFYSCLPNIKLWIMVHKYFPFHDELVSMDKTQLELLVFTVLLIAILVKLYIVIIVWYCYRYMVTMEAFRNLQLLGSTATPSALTSFGLSTYQPSGSSLKFDDESLLISAPPKYDEVIKESVKPTVVSAESQEPSTSSSLATETINETSQPPAYKSVVKNV